MTKEEFIALPIAEQNQLAAKYGLSRGGLNNQIIGEQELTKIPDVKPEPKKKSQKLGAVKVSKLSDSKRVAKKLVTKRRR